MIQAKLYFDKDLPAGGSSIAPGIHADGSVQYLGLKPNDEHWDIKFSNTAGQFLNKRLFAPNANYVNEGETPAEALQRSQDLNVRVLVSLMRALVGEAAKSVEAETYTEFVQKVAEELKEREGSPLCLKVLPNPRGDKMYSKIPDYDFVDSYVQGFPTTLFWKKKEKELMEKHGFQITE